MRKRKDSPSESVSDQTLTNIEYLQELDKAGASTLPSILHLIEDSTRPVYIRERGILLLENLEYYAVRPSLFRVFNDSNEPYGIRLMSAVTLGLMANTHYVDKLLDTLRHSPDNMARGFSARALWWRYGSGTRSEKVFSTLVASLNDPNETDDVKAEVAVAMANIDSFGSPEKDGELHRDLINLLMQKVENGSPGLKIDLIYAIGQHMWPALGDFSTELKAEIKSLFEMMRDDHSSDDSVYDGLKVSEFVKDYLDGL